MVFANLDQTNLRKIVNDVAVIYNPELKPAAIKAIADTEPGVTALVKELLQQFAEGRVDSNLFIPEARPELFPDKTKSAGEFLKSLGPHGLVEPVERKEVGGARIYRYRIIFKEASLFCTIWLTKEDKLAGIRLRPE